MWFTGADSGVSHFLIRDRIVLQATAKQSRTYILEIFKDIWNKSLCQFKQNTLMTEFLKSDNR